MDLEPILKRPTGLVAMFACPICCTFYPTEAQAEYCFHSFPLANQIKDVKPGDVVTVNRGYGWYINKEWVSHTIPGKPKAASHFDRMDTHVFYYVITAIHREVECNGNPYMFRDNRRLHRALVSMVSGALTEKGQPLHPVWTSRKTHIGWNKVKDQASVAHIRALAEEHIGTISHTLM
jgi:hypothetical protein